MGGGLGTLRCRYAAAAMRHDSQTPTPGHPGAERAGGDPTPRARWALRLLGAFELSDGTQRLTRLASRPMVALLARLALAPERAHPREELVELLWPGVDPQVSRNRLRQTLSVLRSLLEPPSAVPWPVLLADRHEVRLVRGAIDCDVGAFERAARGGRPAAALELYRGELLPGHFDEWVLDERQRLQAVSERLADHLASGRAAGPPAEAMAAPLAAASPAASGAAAHPSPPGPSPGAYIATPLLAPHSAPPTAGTPRAAAPVYLTRHFLPEPLRQHLQATLAEHRLVTLVGPGGSGKTRLAVELLPALAPAQGLAFVSLVSCESRAQALDAITAALGAPGGAHPRGDDVEPLVRALQGRTLLLVLDNFEHLVDEAADVVARLAGALPSLRLLVTSRRALGLDGEYTIPVAALPLPERGQATPLAEALANPAVALFVDRARHVRSDFHLNERNRPAIVELMHTLEGLPLAIELAASRVRSLAPARILELLGSGEASRLELLARGGPRGAMDARLASMDAVVRWSWQLLGGEETSLLHALVVFGGGCTAAAAAAVRGISPLVAATRLDALVACSMLRASETPWGEMRFDMYEPIREYARADLRRTSAGAEAALRAAHRAWMLEWAEALPSTPSLPALRAELPNLSTALHSALTDGDAVSAVRTVLALGRAHDSLMLGADSLALLEQAVARCDDVELRSRGHTQLAHLLFAAARGDEARRHAELGLEQVPDEPALRARALHVKARLHWLLEGYAPWLDAAVDEAEALARAAQDTQVLPRLTVLRAAITYAHRHDLVRGEALYRQALAMWQRLGDRHAINAGRYFVALVVEEAGRYQEAIDGADEVVASARELADTQRVSQALQVRGKALAALRRWPEAAAALHEAIRLAWDGMAPVELTRALRDLPAVLAHRRRAEAAVRLQAYAARAAEAHVGRADRYDQQQQRRVQRLVSGRLSPPRCEALRAEGAAMSQAGAVALALAETASDAGAASASAGG